MVRSGGSARGVARGSRPAFRGIRVAEGLDRVLAVGEVVRGAVRSVDTSGAVILELAGRRVRAVTDVPLGAGATYEFRVVECVPRVVLTPLRLLPLPPRAEAAAGGWLGPPPEAVARAAGEELAAMSGAGAPAIEHGLQTLAHGPPAAEDLARLVRWLASRRGAEALRRLALENERRARSGVPEVLPLPLPRGAWLRDGRLFAQLGEERSTPAGVRRPCQVVLLAELAALGQVRVDVELCGAEIGVRFTVERSDAREALSIAAPELEGALRNEGLVVRDLSFRPAGPSGVRVADLVAPAGDGDPLATVDVRV